MLWAKHWVWFIISFPIVVLGGLGMCLKCVFGVWGEEYVVSRVVSRTLLYSCPHHSGYYNKGAFCPSFATNSMYLGVVFCALVLYCCFCAFVVVEGKLKYLCCEVCVQEHVPLSVITSSNYTCDVRHKSRQACASRIVAYAVEDPWWYHVWRFWVVCYSCGLPFEITCCYNFLPTSLLITN